MSREISTQGYFMHDLTKITLRENYDGIHIKENTIGYIAEEPFCVLCELLCKYYVSQYDLMEVFVPGFFPGKYTIGIYNVGSRYLLDNFTKHVYHDLSTFLEDDHGFDFELYKAAVESDDSPITQKYIEFLNMSSEKERIMNMAFEYQDIIRDVEQGDESEAEYNNRIHDYFKNRDLSKMDTIELKNYFLIQQYIFKRIAEQITTN